MNPEKIQESLKKSFKHFKNGWKIRKTIAPYASDVKAEYHETPIDQLENILKKIQEPAYDAWFKTLPSYQKEEKIPK